MCNLRSKEVSSTISDGVLKVLYVEMNVRGMTLVMFFKQKITTKPKLIGCSDELFSFRTNDPMKILTYLSTNITVALNFSLLKDI
jgi:hypothetical protein